jgi:hypothetical protein
LGWQGVGKTHLAVAIGRQAILAGYTVLFVSTPTLVAQLAKAHSEGRLEDRLTHFGKPKLLIVDELGYLPFEPNAAARPAHLAHRLRGPAREHHSIRPPRYSRYLRLHARRQWLRWDRQAMCGDLHWAGRRKAACCCAGSLPRSSRSTSLLSGASSGHEAGAVHDIAECGLHANQEDRGSRMRAAMRGIPLRSVDTGAELPP